MEKYKDLGFKLTPQRIAILKYLEGNTSHPSAEDIYRAVSRSFPTMSFATVYNTLEALRKRGTVLELTSDPGKKRFETNVSPHHHLVCMRCRRIIDLDVDYDLRLPETAKQGFEIISNHIEFYGICPACRGT